MTTVRSQFAFSLAKYSGEATGISAAFALMPAASVLEPVRARRGSGRGVTYGSLVLMKFVSVWTPIRMP